MGVYKNNKDGTLNPIAPNLQIVDAPMENFLTRGEFSAVTPNDIGAENQLVAENEVTLAVDTMPTASLDLLDKIYQYTGTTTVNYTNGYFYKCVSDGEPTPTYSWQVISFSSDPSNKMNTDGSNASNLVEFSGSFTVGSRLANSTVGTNSVAEGEDNTADGNNAHAEGYNNVAHGVASHAEGQNCTSNGYYSHAEGYGTYSTGTASHTSGRGTRAGYAYQMVCGQYNNNDSTTLFEVGNGSDNNNRSNAFQVYSDGSVACGVNRDNKQGTVFEIGNGADSSNLSNAFEVYSDGAISQNNGTDKYKFAKNNSVDGFYDGAGTFHAFGEDRMTIDGSNSADLVRFKRLAIQQSEYNSLSVTSIVKPSGTNQTVTITLPSSEQIGIQNFFNSIIGTSFANSTFYLLIDDAYKALDVVSLLNTSLTGTLVDDVTDEINITTNANIYIKSVYKDIQGLQIGSANITGKNAVAVGGRNVADNNAVACGSQTKATGRYSIACGIETSATGVYSIACGYLTSATGSCSVSEGYYSQSSASYSHSEGTRTIAGYTNQHVCGKYNDNKSATLFEVGNGGSTSVRSNAFEVYSDGSLSTDNGTTKTKLPVIKTATILANASPATATFTDMPSSGNHLVSFYTSMVGLDYNSISQSGNTVTLTYDTQTVDVTVYCSIVEVV